MKEIKTQFGHALLTVLTVAAVISAFLNFQQNFQPGKRYRPPEDGVTWVERTMPNGSKAITALHVVRRSPAENAGIREGDRLLKLHNNEVREAVDVARLLDGRTWLTTEYIVERGGVQLPAQVRVAERTPDATVPFQYAIGLAYLAIGLFVYLRRRNAPKSLHFLILCLVSFVFSCFHYTGKLNPFDTVMYWGSIAAGLFAPTIFLHFCLTFPEPRRWLARRGAAALLYIPALALLAVIVGVATGTLRIAVSAIELRWMLDRIQLGFLSGMYLLGAGVLNIEYRRNQDAIIRQQLKWLRNGAVLGIVPFTAFYVVPYLLGAAPGTYMRLAVVTLPLIPLTWAYAIVRYRLMDVDVIFQQGYVYTLATLGVLGVFYGLLVTFGQFNELSPTAIVVLVILATVLFQPIRNSVQETLDRHVFYKDKYDYRRTLVAFARELSAETDLERMLASVADRLTHTLGIGHVAFFLRDGQGATGPYRLVMTTAPLDRHPDSLDLSFLPAEPAKPYLFFERTRHVLDVVFRDLPQTVRHTIADLDLTYYVSCNVRGRTIAYLGVSRTDKGDFLSSDDLELLVTLSGYVAIAIENARLYQSLQQKADEYERLKEFSENIVESISVGILAVDLQDRVESWNTQIEKLTGISREHAVGRSLSELFPAELVEQIDSTPALNGVHNIYKFVLKPEAIVNIAIAPLVSKDLEQIGRLIIFDDITDRSELERRLVQADKLSSIGLLAAGVAHEVNTPLAVISTYAQMLAKQISGDDQKTRLLEKIAKQTFRASEIVNSLLNFSRTSAAEFTEVDLNRVIGEVLSLIGHQLDKSRVTPQLELQRDLPYIKGNAGKLQQVFLNLVLNARDAMQSGGTLTIATKSDHQTVHVNVSDTGEGIQPEHLSRIYDPFFTTKVNRKGTGLGLSVTYGIVQEHAGSIEVQSHVGSGTLFHLEFPLAAKTARVRTSAAIPVGGD